MGYDVAFQMSLFCVDGDPVIGGIMYSGFLPVGAMW